MLSVANKHIMLNVVMLSVVMLSVVTPSQILSITKLVAFNCRAKCSFF